MPKLTAKQEAFVQEYLIDLNATQAAIRAGYSEKSAMEQGYQLLHKTSVASAIASAKAKRAKKTGIDAEYVLKKSAEFLAMCAGDIPIKKVTRAEDGTLTSEDVHEFNPSGYGKALELLGKHVDVSAFSEKVEVTGKLELTREQILDQLK